MRIALALLVMKVPADDLLALRIADLVAVRKQHRLAGPNLNTQPDEQLKGIPLRC